MKKLILEIKRRRSAAKKLERLMNWAVNSPEVMDALVELAEKTAKDALLQGLYNEMKSRDIDTVFLKKLAETANFGIVIDVETNNMRFQMRREDVGDELAKQRFRELTGSLQRPAEFAIPPEIR